MARADLLCDIIKYGLNNGSNNFRKAAEAICAEERSNQHYALAKKIVKDTVSLPSRNGSGDSIVSEKIPVKKLEQLLLPLSIIDNCNELIEEHQRQQSIEQFIAEWRSEKWP
ncbi:MAG: hypothetical protein FWG30_08865 [Eubacteriaceae bacterium]|jgi:hypothetical protein|nr:hypothetical protein [Eubacteriaceae bacterium]